ncbi:MAG TPA: response regulator, partial [Longimicrobium sp.]|nr:response regulator [Longimicrobium sp.]
MTGADAIVYVLDDDPSVRESLSSLLRSVGLRVETFAAADAFLACRRPEVPSCLVLDVDLGDSSGLDLPRELSASAAPIPIIFMTGYGTIPM